MQTTINKKDNNFIFIPIAKEENNYNSDEELYLEYSSESSESLSHSIL